jgi:hypothetical protein
MLARVGARPRAADEGGTSTTSSGLFVVTLGLLSGSCILGPKPILPSSITAGTFCASPYPLDASRSRSPPSEDDSVPAPAAAERGYATHTLETCRAIGVLGLVERLAEARAREASETEVASLRAEIFYAISMATLDLASTVAHIECEEGRASEIAANLRDAETEQTRRLTAFSLMLSAAGAVAAGVLDLTDKNMTASSIVGITGGVAGGALGFATLAVHRTADFRHERNILGEFWYGRPHPDFPDAIWTYLSRPQSGMSPGRSTRESLISKWRTSGRLGKDPTNPSADRIALYFGAGGIYDADELEDRAEMLLEVRDVIDLMNHDLRQLETDVSSR